MGSLPGAGACQKVTRAYKGQLNSDGNRVFSIKAKAGLIARATARASAKAGLSDPPRRNGTPGA